MYINLYISLHAKQASCDPPFHHIRPTLPITGQTPQLSLPPLPLARVKAST